MDLGQQIYSTKKVETSLGTQGSMSDALRLIPTKQHDLSFALCPECTMLKQIYALP